MKKAAFKSIYYSLKYVYAKDKGVPKNNQMLMLEGFNIGLSRFAYPINNTRGA